MQKYKYKLFIFLIFFPLCFTNAQISSEYEFNSLYKKLFIGTEAGANWGIFDNDKSTLNLNTRFTLEYSIFNWEDHSIGMKQFFGAGNLRSTSNTTEPSIFESDQFNLGVGAVYSFVVSETLYPYTMLGITSFLVNNKKGSYLLNEVNLTAEIGLKLFAADNLIFNLNGGFNLGKNEVLDNILPGDQDETSYAFNFGISYGIGLFSIIEDTGLNDESEFTGGLSSIGPVIDSDNDGIPDFLDKCPDTPKFLKVDSAGCALDADLDGVPDYLDQCPDTPQDLIVDSYGCPIDSDSDGVPDYLDQCPDTKNNMEVDENGCTIDDDMDGVPNSIDICPDSKPGIEVDSLGCEIKIIEDFKKIIRTVYFDYDNPKISRSDYLSVLDELLKYMEENPNSVWQVAAHSDGFESSQSQNQISQKRAEFIKDYFVSNGIEENRIQTFDMGSEYPVESNLTISGRAKNRRAVILRTK
jgi:OOP family OmpA-OmpF porin